EERLRDFHKALFAEIRTTMSQLQEGGPEVTDTIVARMKADEAFIPFIPHEHHDRIYASLIGQIEVLPRATIDEIVRFYALVGMFSGLAEDMRGAKFSAMQQERRVALYEDYVGTRRLAFRQGELALSVISAYALGGKAAAEQAAEDFSNPGADRDAPRASGEKE
ncbi:MAG: hypothetical protein AAF618_12335, partial [Pseudomonadota bacterium]